MNDPFKWMFCMILHIYCNNVLNAFFNLVKHVFIAPHLYNVCVFMHDDVYLF